MLDGADKCERCGNCYTVETGLQHFCLNYREQYNKECNRKTPIDFYHENKDGLNTKRKRRRIGNVKYDWCNKHFESKTKRLTCSDECYRLIKIKKMKGPDIINKKRKIKDP